MDIQLYMDKVIARFKSGNASKAQWKLLGQLWLEASSTASKNEQEYTIDSIMDFDAAILSSEEYNDQYGHLRN